MAKVGHILTRAPPNPLDTPCGVGRYKSQTWLWACEHDPEWVWWVLTDSRYLLPREIHNALTKGLRGLTKL